MPSRKPKASEEALESALKDGTRLSGFVTAKENKPPRDCGHCKWLVDDGCSHPVVRIDPELRDRLQPNRNVEVAPEDCCDFYQYREAKV